MMTEGSGCQRRAFTRREALGTIGGGIVGLAGCLSGPSLPDADVIAGPDNRNAFDPEGLTVSVGTTVLWGFASAGHNVCCRPEHSDEVTLPGSAETFASYGPDDPPEGTLVPRGETYKHTFTESGTYRYVCVPHDGVGMVGTITVG